MTRTTMWGLAAAAVLALSTAPAPATAQQVPAGTTSMAAPPLSPADSALDAQTAAVSSQLRCPICQGESIQDSPSSLAQEMRGIVRQRLAAGETPAQVKAYFVSKYGEWILLDPRAHGFNLVLYAAPYVLLAGGLVLVVVAVKKWTGSGKSAEA